MRNHEKLRAYEIADTLALKIYQATRYFPNDERYGLFAQMRRCVVSVPSNIVEGCARHTTRDYVKFLQTSYRSACELQYQVSLAELGIFGNRISPRIGGWMQRTYKGSQRSD